MRRSPHGGVGGRDVPGVRALYIVVLARRNSPGGQVWQVATFGYSMSAAVPPVTPRGVRPPCEHGVQDGPGHLPRPVAPPGLPAVVRTARREHEHRLPEDLRLTSRARVRDEIGAPGSGDLPTFPCVLARPVRLGYALSTCPRVAHPPRVAALREFRRPSLSPCRAVGLKGRPSSFTVAAQVPLSSRASSYADLTVRGGLHDRQPFRLPAPVQGRSGCR